MEKTSWFLFELGGLINALFVFTIEVVVDIRLLEAEIFSFIKPQQNDSVNANPNTY